MYSTFIYYLQTYWLVTTVLLHFLMTVCRCAKHWCSNTAGSNMDGMQTIEQEAEDPVNNLLSSIDLASQQMLELTEMRRSVKKMQVEVCIQIYHFLLYLHLHLKNITNL